MVNVAVENNGATRRQILPLGDRALLVEFVGSTSASLSGQIFGFCEAVKSQDWRFVQDLVPAFQSVCIHYDPLVLLQSGMTFAQWLAALDVLDGGQERLSAPRKHLLPICYDLRFGIDLQDVAQRAGLSVQAVIDLHVAGVYRVAMIGFAPGFPYLEGLPPSLQLPRRATPRSAVAAGSVAIVENLCGIYPVQLPGGWHVVGRTPVVLFDAARDVPSLLQVGDLVRFERIDCRQFEAMCAC